MRFAVLLLLLATTTFAASAQYRTLNDRFEPPRFTSLDAWAPRAAYIRKHILSSAGLVPMPDKTPLRPVVFDEIVALARQ